MSLGACLVVLYIQRLGRKTIYAGGHFFMAVFLLICGFSIKNSWNMVSFVMILLYTFAY